MFKGIVFLLVIGLLIVCGIVAIVVSVIFRTIHNVKKAINGETDNYNPEIGKKRQHYTHGAYGKNTARQQSATSASYESTAQQKENIHKTETGEVLFETRNPEQANRQIFTADEGEYVEFSEEG